MLFCATSLCPLHARTVKQDTLTAEEQQQFLYYFYEAQRLIQIGDTHLAEPLIDFCYALKPNDATVNNYKGMYARIDGDSLAMDSFFRQAYLLEPEEYWYNHHVLLLQSEQKWALKLAVTQMEELVQQNIQDEELYTLLQKAYIQLKQYRRALKMQDQLDSISGYDAKSAIYRYRINAMLGNEKQAIYEVERYLEMDPDYYQFQMFRMQLYEQTKQPAEKMLEAYEAVLRLDPRNIPVMNNLAWTLCLMGKDLLRAEQLSRTTIMRDPTNPIYLDTYGWILHLLGDCESALFYLETAIEHSEEPIDKEILTHYKKVQKACK